MSAEEKNPHLRSACMALYIVTGAGGVLQFFDGLLLVSLVILGIAWFMAKAQRIAARGTIYASHAEWAARTMSIGGTVLFPIALLIGCFIIWHSVDIDALKTSIQNDEADNLGAVVQGFLTSNMEKISHITDIASLPPTFWWVRRCWVGLLRAKQKIPIDYPHSWL
ncbi:MAG: hypothetical protein HY052_07340 [Proteobacteria bacterium]|nr:hypothetical protein [Pseudomonadota bacterium]